MSTATFCSCPICGKPLPLGSAGESEAAACGYCGLKVRIQALYGSASPAAFPPAGPVLMPAPAAGAAGGKPDAVPPVAGPAAQAQAQVVATAGAGPSTASAASEPPLPMAGRPQSEESRGESAAAGAPEASAAPARTCPLRAFPLGRSSDAALVGFARACIQEQGWPCQAWEGRDAFATEARLPGTEGGAEEVCNVTVSASGGVLTLETIAARMPPPPWRPLYETLNRLNLCSRGPVFLAREYGVVLRTLFSSEPQTREFLSPEKLLHALVRLMHDRRAAQPILENVGGESVPRHIERAFALAAPPFDEMAISLTQLQVLACSAGCHPYESGPALYLNRMPSSRNQCPVRMLLDGDVLRCWAFLAGDLPGGQTPEKHPFVRQVLGQIRESPVELNPAQAAVLLERLNSLNEASIELRYVWSGRQVLAMAVYTPALRDMKVSTFKRLAEMLFCCTSAEAQGLGRHASTSALAAESVREAGRSGRRARADLSAG